MALRPGDGRRHAHILRDPKIMVVVVEVELQSVQDPLAGADDLFAVFDRVAVKQLVACLLDDPHRVVKRGFHCQRRIKVAERLH